MHLVYNRLLKSHPCTRCREGNPFSIRVERTCQDCSEAFSFFRPCAVEETQLAWSFQVKIDRTFTSINFKFQIDLSPPGTPTRFYLSQDISFKFQQTHRRIVNI